MILVEEILIRSHFFHVFYNYFEVLRSYLVSELEIFVRININEVVGIIDIVELMAINSV